MSAKLHQDVGRLQGTVRALGEKVDGLRKEVAPVLAYVTAEKARRRTVYIVAGSAASLCGTLAGLAVAWFK